VLEQLKEERRKYIESLNENVQNAIKIAESKGHSTDFTNKLVALNEKDCCLQTIFLQQKAQIRLEYGQEGQEGGEESKETTFHRSSRGTKTHHR